MTSRHVSGQRPTQQLFVSGFDDADNNDDNDNGHREAYNNTHLETESAFLSCTTTRSHLHILPPGAIGSERGN